MLSTKSISLLAFLASVISILSFTIQLNRAYSFGMIIMRHQHLEETAPPRHIPMMPAIKPHNISSVIKSINAFRTMAFLFIYNPQTDRFHVIDFLKNRNTNRIRVVASVLARALRLNFPERFPSQHEFAMALSTGDHPGFKVWCLGNSACAGSPVLQFGSVYRDKSVSPMSMIPMPMHVVPHLPCFDSWQYNMFVNKKREVCKYLQPNVEDPTLTASERGHIAKSTVLIKHGLYMDQDAKWEGLIPQIIWRGTDFDFLENGKHVRPKFNKDVKAKLAGLNGNDATKAAIQALYDFGDDLLPRWKGVLLTSKAERITNETDSLPWANIKFSVNRDDVLKWKLPNLEAFHKVGIATIGEFISVQNQSGYRYHIDLGGGGGTTFTGTIEKLAMPGVLFHHMTETKDYFHDMLKEWDHYIPVQTNLNDLEANFQWAEMNAHEAQKISKRATEFMLWMGSPDGFESIYNDFLIDPLRHCIESYEPLDIGKSVMDFIKESSTRGYEVVANFTGRVEKWDEEVVILN